MAKRKAVRGSRRKGCQGSKQQPRSGHGKENRRLTQDCAQSRQEGRPKGQGHGQRSRTKARRAVRRAKPAARPRVVAKKKTPPARKRAPVKAKVTAKATAHGSQLGSHPPRKRAAAPQARSAKDIRPVARTAPGLNRERRTISDDERVPSPPSSLDLNRTASAARSGRREMLEKYEEHTETSPELTGGDVDADWESAYSVGDEAPGGDNPTPDQDIVDDIGKAVGVQYQDNEELKGEKKLLERDKHRWELDPASSDDWEDR